MLLLNFLLQGWPEGAAIFFLCFSIVNYKFKIREIITYSFLFVLFIYIFRLLPIPFGLHTMVGAIVLVVIIYKVTKAPLGISFVAAFSVLFLICLIEFVVHWLVNILIGNITPEQVWLWIVIGWPNIMGLVGVAIIIKKFRPSIKKYRWLNE